jgi:thiol-disulfide isomerase/thioredoxin/tetratricopeptide (TPR) repeat protein
MKKIILFIFLPVFLLTSLIISQESTAPAQEPTQQQMKELQTKLNATKDAVKKIEILKEFATQFPKSRHVASAYNYILQLYIRELKDPDKAISFAENIMKTEKIEANKTAVYIFLFNRYLENNTEQAAKIAEKILNLDIKDSSLYDGIASALVQVGSDLKLAEKLSNKAINLSTLQNLKNNPRFRNAAEEYLKRIIEEQLAYYNDTLGWIYFKQGRHEEAIQALEKSLDKSTKDFLQLPFYANTLFNLGTAYMKTNKNEKALPLLIKSLMVSDKPEIHSALKQSYQKKFGSIEGLENFIKNERNKLAQPAPDFTLKNLQGKEVSLSSFKGKVVLLNLFSPTCGSCAAELPHLEALHKKYNKKGFSALIVDIANLSDETNKVAEKNNYTMTILLNGNILQEKYTIPGTPMTYLIDKRGKAIYRHIGYRQGDEKKMEKEIIDLLGIK